MSTVTMTQSHPPKMLLKTSKPPANLEKSLQPLQPQPQLQLQLQPQSQSDASKASVFPFLHLPIELRLEIYAHLLILPSDDSDDSNNSNNSHSVQNYDYYHHHHTHQKDPSTAPLHPQILLTSRQVNNEATDLLYRKNTFLAHPILLTAFPRLPPLPDPLARPAAAARVRRVRLRLRLDEDLPFKPADAEAALSGLERVEVQLVQRTFLGVGCRNLGVLEGVRGVGRVSIWGSTTGFEKYVAWLAGTMMKPAGEAQGDTYGDRYEEGLVERMHLSAYL
ncbi:hypothetical protein N3K66_006635 [Trichothecium roseum]|uniref:Uncharacterized protein n=1 Tax=Trichothecium roseum TaxID=47278 RepID=A0ACC0UXP4_9HYPO|nr:hypothetical protein N3K66_006635 [Trichothecium roseum]